MYKLQELLNIDDAMYMIRETFIGNILNFIFIRYLIFKPKTLF